MKLTWSNPKHDPIPALMYEAYAYAVRQKEVPCSICRNTDYSVQSTGYRRKHFHGSELGACKRKTLYQMLNPLQHGSNTKPEFLDDGHVHENAVLVRMHNGLNSNEDIRELFGAVNVVPASNRAEQTIKINYMRGKDPENFKIVAHIDGTLCLGEGLTGVGYLLECKAVKTEKFQKIKNGEMDKEWYGQIQSYLHIYNFTRAYLIVKNRETGAIIQPIRIDYDSNYLKERRKVLVEVHKAVLSRGMVDREHAKHTESECQYCPFYAQCWKGDKSAQYKEQEDEQSTKKTSRNKTKTL